jgi:hypothetical protein
MRMLPPDDVTRTCLPSTQAFHFHSLHEPVDAARSSFPTLAALIDLPPSQLFLLSPLVLSRGLWSTNNSLSNSPSPDHISTSGLDSAVPQLAQPPDRITTHPFINNLSSVSSFSLPTHTSTYLPTVQRPCTLYAHSSVISRALPAAPPHLLHLPLRPHLHHLLACPRPMLELHRQTLPPRRELERNPHQACTLLTQAPTTTIVDLSNTLHFPRCRQVTLKLHRDIRAVQVTRCNLPLHKTSMAIELNMETLPTRKPATKADPK